MLRPVHSGESDQMDMFDEKKLAEFKKPQLIELVLELQKEKNLLIKQKENVSDIQTRLCELERSHFLYLQYGRRESVEITGIPKEVPQEDLEQEVIKIYKEAKVSVHGKELSNFDISACHRIGKRDVTIVRFTNRKFAMEGLYKGKNLKGTKLYGSSPIYINNSFCREEPSHGLVQRLTGHIHQSLFRQVHLLFRR